MNKDEEIRILVARFMDGDTTLDEECKLYCYFSGDEVSDDLLPMREYFRSIAVMRTPKQHQHKVQPVLYGLDCLACSCWGGGYVVANGTTGLLRGLHLQ